MRAASERSLRARLAAHESWAQTTDRTARTVRARAAFLVKFEQQVDPGGVLDPTERAIRAERACKAWCTRMALKPARARRKARELTADADLAEGGAA